MVEFAYFKEYLCNLYLIINYFHLNLPMPLKLVEKHSPINQRSNFSTSGKSSIYDVFLAIELKQNAQYEPKAENKLLLDALRHGSDSLTSRFDSLSAT